MKKLYKYIVSVIGILAFSACTDDVEFPNVVEEGNDVTLTLNIQASADKNIVVSRATNDENKLYDLHFYVFNQQGKLTGYEQRVHGDGFIIPINDKGNIPTDQYGNTMLQNITIRTKTGISTIYALANINQGDTYYLEDGIKARLNVTDQATNAMSDSELAAKVKESTLKLSDFKNIQYLRQAGDASKWYSPTPQHNKYVMSGYLNNGHQVTIEKVGTEVSVNGSDDNIIKLYRILAKNTLTIDWNSSGGHFTPKYYKLCEVPTRGMLIPNTDIRTAYGETEDLYLTKANIEEVQNIPVISTYRENLSLTSEEKTAKRFELIFHYPENLRSYNKNTNITQWKHRETNSYNIDGEKSFDNAPSSAAYIELYGDYVSSDGNLTANVSYTIHLGNFSQKSGTGDDVLELNAKRMSDFNVVRNHNYIYNVYIKGVDDVIAEAKDQHDNPYAEGLVIQKGDGVNFEVDAHYEARVMKFSRATMNTLKASEGNPGYVVNISTPFGNTSQTLMVKNMTHNGTTGDYICSSVGTPLALLNSDGTYTELGDDKVFVGEQDYSWMEFVRNTTGNMHNGLNRTLYPCKYPRSTDTTNPKLNVFQLLAELYKTTGDGNVYDSYGITAAADDKEVYYTCFINEYYYNKKPWNTYTNKPNRYMQIAIQKENLYVSDDNKSVYAEVAYSISQRSITTVYNPLLNIIAFGTENVDEEDVYNERLGKYVSSNSNQNKLYTYYENILNVSPQNWKGWTSATATIKNEVRPWYDNEGSTEYGNDGEVALVNVQGVQPMYRAALKACMSRNRDNDGDEKIDGDEIRWYLATVDQYRALFYGQSLLDEDVRLFGTQEDLTELQSYAGSYNFEQRGIFHYWTSSNRENSGTFWPEEGMTNNPAGNAQQYLGWNGVCRAELVRCVRTLGNGTTGVIDDGLKDPEEFFNFYSTDNSGNKNVISVHGMVVKRIPSEDALPNHNESEATWNDFTSKIAVAAYDLRNSSDSESNFSSTIAEGDDPCSDYRNQSNVRGTDEANYNWRMPNQKEFALILATVDKMPTTGFDKNNFTKARYVTRTHFSGNWHPDSRSKTAYIGAQNGSINLSQYSNNARIRCVRDVD